MGVRKASKMRGFMVPDPRMTSDDLAVNDATATGSDYTQRGARPGSATIADTRSLGLPIIVGGQQEAIDIRVESAGRAGIDDSGARMSWKFDSEAATEFRGYCDPQWSTVWMPVAFDTVGLFVGLNYDAVVHPATQRVVEVHTFSTTSTRSNRSADIWEFEAGATVSSNGGGFAVGEPALTVLPSGRLLCLDGDRVFYSDDIGTTWATYAVGVNLVDEDGFAPLPNPVTRRRMHATKSGDVLVMVEDGLGNVAQFASRDLGATFSPVEVQLSLGDFLSIAETPTGSLVVSYIDTTPNRPRSRTIASPFEPISLAPEVEIDASVNADEVALVFDGRGVGWAFATSGPNVRLYRTLDGALSWDLMEFGPWNSQTSNFEVRNIHAVAARGFVWLFHRPYSAGAGLVNESIAVFRLGGWSNFEPAENVVALGDDQFGWFDPAGAVGSRTWAPFDPPAGTWTQIGALAGVVTVATASMDLPTVAQDGYYEQTMANDLGLQVYAQTSTDGAGGSLATPEHGIRLQHRQSGTDYHATISFLSTSSEIRFRVRDVFGAVDLFEIPVSSNIAAPQAGGAPAPWLEIYAQLQGAGGLTVLYRRSDQVNWTSTGLLAVTGGAGTDTRAHFGALVAGTTLQRWRAFNVANLIFSGLNDTGLLRGASIASTPLSLVDAGVMDTDEGGLYLRGGPAVFGEVYDVDPVHDFPLSAVFWDRSPSRDDRWRSANATDDNILTFEFPEQTRIGGSFLLGLFVAEANFRRARLEVDTTGAGVWALVATLDLAEGLEPLPYVRTGDQLRPGTLAGGLVEADRFVNRAELVRGVAEWDGALGSTAARIEANSAGGWTDAGVNTIQPFVRVDSDAVAGSSVVSQAGAGLILRAPSGLVVAHLDDPAGLVFGVRVVIEGGNAGGISPDGEDYREAGLIMIGAITPFGQQWSRGYSAETRPNALADVSPHGTIRKQEEGPPAMQFSVAWPDGVKLDQMRQGPDVDFLGPVGKPPAVADSDVWGQLWGVLDETKSGQIPVVIVSELPADNVTVTDRTLFSFGTVDGSARFDHVLGDEGENEFGRISGVAVQEIR